MFMLEVLGPSAPTTSSCDGAVVVDNMAYAARLAGGSAMMALLRGFELMLMLIKVSDRGQSSKGFQV